jgi:hypothetical protein
MVQIKGLMLFEQLNEHGLDSIVDDFKRKFYGAEGVVLDK